MIRTTCAAAIAVLALSACESDSYGGGGGGGGGGGDAWGFGPGYVSIGDNKRFGVRYLPDMKAAVLNFTLVGSFDADGELPEPPVADEWREAAEKAAPDGCTLATLEKVDEETFQAVYDCEDGA